MTSKYTIPNFNSSLSLYPWIHLIPPPELTLMHVKALTAHRTEAVVFISRE